LRPRLIHAALLGAAVLVGSPGATGAGARSTVSEVPLPGGIRSAQAAVGDRALPDRAQFLFEFIRRTYDSPFDLDGDPRQAALQSLLAVLEAGAAQPDSFETIPLPLSEKIWIDAVFGGRATPQTLVAEILKSRNAALLYCGLLWLDDDTRAWLATEPALVAELASGRAAEFLAAAPGLQASAAGARLPGGAEAAPVWTALVGQTPDEPAAFVRKLVASDGGRLARFLGTLGQLAPAQVRVALGLTLPDVEARVDSARRVYSVCRRLSRGFEPVQRAFMRPVFDPALLISDLPRDERGQPLLPGSRGFWKAVFADRLDPEAGSARQGSRVPSEWTLPLDFAWLCEQVFEDEPAERRRRYMMVLFASRRLPRDPAAETRDAIEAVRAAGEFPALVGGLERAGINDLATFAIAARRAASLSQIGDHRRAARALAQYQGALALVTYAASRRSLAAGRAAALISSLSEVPLSRSGDYEGRLAYWLSGWMAAEAEARAPSPRPNAPQGGPSAAGISGAPHPIEHVVVGVLAGAEAKPPRFVEWEGTRYRLDLAAAEASRLKRALGDPPGLSLSSAVTVVAIADALADARLTREELRHRARELAAVADAAAASGGAAEAPVPPCCGDVTDALQRAAAAGDMQAARRLTPGLRHLADVLLARGFAEMAYALALGQRDGGAISAAEAASRHDFGLGKQLGRVPPWRNPSPDADDEGRWCVTGSLIGLDVGLAGFSLIRFSQRLPPAPPSLDAVDRRVLIEAVALVDSASLSDADRDAIAAAIRAGRARLGAAKTARDAIEIADEVSLGTLRRTLLTWTLLHDPGRTSVFLSPSELLWLGGGRIRLEALQAWGAPAGPRQGCHCLRFAGPGLREIVAGRRSAGMMASAFPDLNVRLAELLGELRMPAALLGPVLRAAALDFVNGAVNRDPDDWRGVTEFVQALGPEHLEQYLALLTTDGPLVPAGPAEAAAGPGPALAAGVLFR
jgi:hypothetical protein